MESDADFRKKVARAVEFRLNLRGDEPLRLAFHNVELTVLKFHQDVGYAVGTTDFLQIQRLRLPAPDESKYPQMLKNEHRGALMSTICMGKVARPPDVDRVPSARVAGSLHIDARRRVENTSTPCFGGCFGVVSGHFDAPSVIPKAEDASHNSQSAEALGGLRVGCGRPCMPVRRAPSTVRMRRAGSSECP